VFGPGRDSDERVGADVVLLVPVLVGQTEDDFPGEDDRQFGTAVLVVPVSGTCSPGLMTYDLAWTCGSSLSNSSRGSLTLSSQRPSSS
jgi:hypothetical protein